MRASPLDEALLVAALARSPSLVQLGGGAGLGGGGGANSRVVIDPNKARVGNYDEWGGRRGLNLSENDKLSLGNCLRYAFNDPIKEGESSRHSLLTDGTPALDKIYHLSAESLAVDVKKLGAIDIGSGPPPDGFRRILLFMEPDGPSGNDFHFFREDSDGTWSHKRGDRAVVAGVSDPFAEAQFYGYTVSVGIFAVPINGLDVDSPSP